MKTKFIYLCIGIAIAVSFFLFRNDAPKQNNRSTICISQVVEHPALNATVKGIKDELDAQGFIENETCNIFVESAQGQTALASQIASKFINQESDVVVGVGTLSAQSFLKYTKSSGVNLVFSSVTDPVSATLVDSENKSPNSVCGVSNFVPLEPQLELFKKIQPNLQKLGIIYNPSELNSVSIVNKLQKICPLYGIQVVTQVLTTTADAMQVATQLAGQVDAIFISNDNTALSALRTIINVTNKSKIPTYVSNTDAVEMGALAALGPNQYYVGRQTGKLIAKVLKKEPIIEAVEYPKQVELFLNLRAAQKLDITVPGDLIEQSKSVIRGAL